MKAERKSKTQRAYDVFCEASGKLDAYSETELKRILAVIGADPDSYATRLVIYDYHWWIDTPDLGGMTALSSGSLSEDWTMLKRLAFFREEKRNHCTSKFRNEVRLVAECKVDNVTIWLDVETGLPWLPNIRVTNRKYLSAEDQQRIQAVERRVGAAAERERRQILHEQTEQLIWADQGIDYDREARTEVLSLMRRPNRRAEWKTVATYATRYYPAGSALYSQEEREAFRVKYLAGIGHRDAETQSAIYPAHDLNHTEMHEVAA